MAGGRAAVQRRFVRTWLLRQNQIVDDYQPDLMYFDDTGLPLGQTGLEAAAHYYNQAIERRGDIDVVLFGKQLEGSSGGRSSRTSSAGCSTRSAPDPWQTDTCIGDWHYDRRHLRRERLQERRSRSSRCCRHRLQERQPAAQHPGARRRHDRREGRGDRRPDRVLDEAQRRGDLRHPAVAQVRRRTDQAAAAGQVLGGQVEAVHRRRHPLHEKGRRPSTRSSSIGRRARARSSRSEAMLCPARRSNASTCSAVRSCSSAAMRTPCASRCRAGGRGVRTGAPHQRARTDPGLETQYQTGKNAAAKASI